MKNKLTSTAKILRKNMTDAERLLWNKIRAKQLGVKFRRQQPLENLVVDFVCFEQKLIIELDGGQHFENKEDEIRDEWLKQRGYKILRFWNNDVLRNIRGVLQVIQDNISPSLNPSRRGRETKTGNSRQGREMVDGCTRRGREMVDGCTRRGKEMVDGFTRRGKENDRGEEKLEHMMKMTEIATLPAVIRNDEVYEVARNNGSECIARNDKHVNVDYEVITLEVQDEKARF